MFMWQKSSLILFSLSKAVVWRCSVEKLFLEILHNSQENTRVCNFIKKETLALVFSCEFREIYNNTIFMEHIRVTASGSHKIIEIKERPSKHLLLLTSTHRKWITNKQNLVNFWGL